MQTDKIYDLQSANTALLIQINSLKEKNIWLLNYANKLKIINLSHEIENMKAMLKEDKDLGNGFILSKTADETILNYKWNLIKRWSYTMPEGQPIWILEDCSILSKAELENESPIGNAWTRLTNTEQKECIKYYYHKAIQIELIDNEKTSPKRFFKVIQSYYESYSIWIYDTKTGNFQEMPATWDLKFAESESWITITIDTKSSEQIKLVYSKDFSKLLSTEMTPEQ